MKYAPKVMISVIGESALTGGRIPEGTDIRFLCRADANPPNVTYRWYINDELVAGDYTTEMVSLFVFVSVCCIYTNIYTLRQLKTLCLMHKRVCSRNVWKMSMQFAKATNSKCLSTTYALNVWF